MLPAAPSSQISTPLDSLLSGLSLAALFAGFYALWLVTP
jgi:hypothetical protein